MSKYIPEPDEKRLLTIYGNSPNRLPQLPPEAFVERVGWELFCRSQMVPQPSPDAFESYSGETFTEWVREETHLQMERGDCGYTWNMSMRRFEGPGDIGEVYSRTRDRVLRGLTECAIAHINSGALTEIRRSLKDWTPKK